MKRLILGAVIAGTLSTAGATQWEYARLDVNSASDIRYNLRLWATWTESKDGNSVRSIGFQSWQPGGNARTIDDFFLKVANFKPSFVSLAQIDHADFQSALGSLGWELISVVVRPDENIKYGSVEELIKTTVYWYKRPVTK